MMLESNKLTDMNDKDGCMSGNSKHRAADSPKSSFSMQDSGAMLSQLGIRQGSTLVDLGCGAGDYALYISDIVGEDGCIYAVDKADVIAWLSERTAAENCRNIKSVACDLAVERLPFEDGAADACFLFTVLHHLAISTNPEWVLSEAYRILKPDGRLYVLECKKETSDKGPPLHFRLSEDQVAAWAQEAGFSKTCIKDLGYNYLLEFVRE